LLFNINIENLILKKIYTNNILYKMKSSSDPPSRPNMNFGNTLLDRSFRPNLRVKDGNFILRIYYLSQ